MLANHQTCRIVRRLDGPQHAFRAEPKVVNKARCPVMMLWAALGYVESGTQMLEFGRRRWWVLRIICAAKLGEPGEQTFDGEAASLQPRQDRGGGDGRLFHAQIDFDVGMGGREVIVAEPGSNGGDIHALLE